MEGTYYSLLDESSATPAVSGNKSLIEPLSPQLTAQPRSHAFSLDINTSNEPANVAGEETPAFDANPLKSINPDISEAPMLIHSKNMLSLIDNHCEVETDKTLEHSHINILNETKYVAKENLHENVFPLTIPLPTVNEITKLDTKNNVNNLENSDCQLNSHCKIFTKYVFINKSAQHKSRKNKFGVLYLKGLRYGYKSKHHKRKLSCLSKQCKHFNLNSEKNSKKEKDSVSKHSGTLTVKTTNVDRNVTKENIKPISRENIQANKRKILSLAEKVEVIKAIDESDSSLLSEASGHGMSRSVLSRLLKNKEKIIARFEAEKHKAKRKKNNVSDVGVKPEKTDSAEEANFLQCDDNDWLKSDSSETKPKFRNRKDLTLEEKVKVIQALEIPGTKINAMAKKFGVSVSSISRINKNKDFIMLKSSSGDLCSKSKRTRECKDPELDRVLLKWYRALEKLHPERNISISNVLLKQKAHDLALVMAKNYLPTDNWIIRWKQRHNLVSKANTVHDRAELQRLDMVNMADILQEAGKYQVFMDQVKKENELRHCDKTDQFFICEHCGVLTSNKRKKENQHESGCPFSAIRKDLTLDEKVQVIRALEEPGVKMIHLAKKYGISASAISRIAKNRVDILARKASGLSNSQRKRDRGSKEPEVERALCEWFKMQHELGVHISGSMIREKAREIAQAMGKVFWPSESWVFRWRQRNNVSDMNAILFAGDSDDHDTNEGESQKVCDFKEDGHQKTDNRISDIVNNSEDLKSYEQDASLRQKEKDNKLAEKKKQLIRSVMCEKCGFVSTQVKNYRLKSLRHAKGCPDMKPRHELTYETRAQMLKALEEPGATLSSVARQFGVSVSSMSRINANKERILNHCQDHSDQKRIRFCKEPEVAQKLYHWYMEKKSEGVHATGTKLKEMARKMAADMGRDFKASSGWLGRWRQRYNIVSCIKSDEMTDSSLPKKKRQRKTQPQKNDSLDNFMHFPSLITDVPQDNSANIITEHNEVQQTTQPPVYLHQRFPAPWDMVQQQSGQCPWPSPGQDDTGVPIHYTYSDGLPKPMFSSMFETFPAVNYQVSVPLDPGLVSRDYLKTASNENKLVPNTSHQLSSSQHSHQHSASLNPAAHPQHHIVTTQVHQPHQVTHNGQLHPHLPTQPQPDPSPALQDEDPEQHRQVMEALRIMNSFAKKKSLGDHVQAALKTIEMTMKSQNPKLYTRNTYTSI